MLEGNWHNHEDFTHHVLYGIDVYKNRYTGECYCYINGKKVEKEDLSDMKYYIQQLQAGIGVVH